MTTNPFDQACRYLLKLTPIPLLAWLLRLLPIHIDFVEWLDARQVPWPGQPDRVCDTVAHLRDPAKGGEPWAVVVEFQIDPDERMFGRGLKYLGDLWDACKPTEHRGDRFHVGLVVVNLRGVGAASRTMRLTGTRVWTGLGVAEKNLSRREARRVLLGVEIGAVPPAVLAWVPLFQGGGEPGIIREWLRLAGQVKDARLRQALGLAEIFAEAAGCREVWREALKEWNVMESQVLKDWTARAEANAELRAAARTVIAVLEARFQSVPTDLVAGVNACRDGAKLDQWARRAGTALTLADFRRDAGV